MALTRLNSLSIPANTVVATDIEDNAITTAKIANDAITAAKIDDNAVIAAAMADDAIGIAELAAPGTADATPVLCGNNTWTAVGGAYSDWLVKTANFTCASGDQLVCNHASTAFTITLPAGSAGNTCLLYTSPSPRD